MIIFLLTYTPFFITALALIATDIQTALSQEYNETLSHGTIQ